MVVKVKRAAFRRNLRLRATRQVEGFHAQLKRGRVVGFRQWRGIVGPRVAWNGNELGCWCWWSQWRTRERRQQIEVRLYRRAGNSIRRREK